MATSAGAILKEPRGIPKEFVTKVGNAALND